VLRGFYCREVSVRVPDFVRAACMREIMLICTIPVIGGFLDLLERQFALADHESASGVFVAVYCMNRAAR
jgi:hypothetical protein